MITLLSLALALQNVDPATVAKDFLQTVGYDASCFDASYGNSRGDFVIFDLVSDNGTLKVDIVTSRVEVLNGQPHPYARRPRKTPIDPDQILLKTEEECINKSESMLRALGLLSEFKLVSVRVIDDKLNNNGTGLDDYAVTTCDFVEKSPKESWLASEPRIGVTFDRVTGKLIHFSHFDRLFRVDEPWNLSEEQAWARVVDLVKDWTHKPEWRVIKKITKGYSYDDSERIRKQKEVKGQVAKWPAYPAYRFDPSDPEGSLIVIRAKDGSALIDHRYSYPKEE